jgi:exopolysaccharide biosynthesis WecB/TagA/CpsF family protein
MSAGIYAIAFFMRDLSGGGVERMRLRLAEGLAARGHAVTLVVQVFQGALVPQLRPEIRIVVLGRNRTLACIRPLARLLRTRQFDIIFSSLDHNNVALLTARILAGSATPVVVCQHNALNGERALGWKYVVIPVLYRLLAPWAAHFIGVSSGVAGDLIRAAGISRNKVSIVYNPVFDAEEQPQCHAEPADPWLSAGASPPLFVFAGRLVPQKDPALAIRAFALYAAGHPGSLALLGEGPLAPELERLISALNLSHRVRLMHFVPRPAAWYKQARALLLTSRYEGFGNVIVEALACGTPVIAANCPHGPAEILGNGRWGRLIQPGDVHGFATAMAEDLRAAFPAEALRARAMAFSRAACVQAHESITRDLLLSAPRAFGIGFTKLSLATIVSRIVHVRPETCQLVVTPNADHVRLLRVAEFAAAYASAAITCADGLPVALYAWLKGASLLQRVTGCDLVECLATQTQLNGRRVLVVTESDATTEAVRTWAGKTQASWRALTAPPKLIHTPVAAGALANTIAQIKPDILLMTLGAPTSEIFIHRYRTLLGPCWALCVGQAVRVELGLTKRAPSLLRRAGFEWIWRIAHEPSRLTGRYCRAAGWLVIAIIRDLAGYYSVGTRA